MKPGAVHGCQMREMMSASTRAKIVGRQGIWRLDEELAEIMRLFRRRVQDL